MKPLIALVLLGGIAAADTVVVTADRMIDVEQGRAIANPAIVITNGKITAVGPRATVKVPTGARTVDLKGMTILPGLIDMHVHLDMDPTYSGYTRAQFSDRFWSVIQVAHAQKTLEAGFTTVRNVGSRHWNDIGLREAIDAGKLRGPRIVTAANSIGATGGHCDSTLYPPSMGEKAPYNVDSVDDARKNVRELRKYGAQVIKLCATGGVFSKNTEPGAQQLSLAEMKAIVDEAHMQGLEVAAHAHGPTGIRDAALAGVDTIEHASLIDDEGIRTVKAKGAFLSMDIYNTEYTQAVGLKNGALPESLEKDRKISTTQRENFKRAHKAGIKMIYGTDAGVYPHGDNAKQLAWMVRYGMTPLQAIQTATSFAALALGARGKDVGTLAVGKHGDLIAVTGDPLANVALLEAIPFVMKGGDVVKDTRKP